MSGHVSAVSGNPQHAATSLRGTQFVVVTRRDKHADGVPTLV